MEESQGQQAEADQSAVWLTRQIKEQRVQALLACVKGEEKRKERKGSRDGG